MMLALRHGQPGRVRSPAAAPALAIWRTCLREVHFLDPRVLEDESATTSRYEVEQQAYALLLEIVAGLRSPLVGETEVQAQFKQFLATTDLSACPWLSSIGQLVLADAKRIRHQFLQGVGARSYGDLVAPWLVGRRAVVVGTGALAVQVLQQAPIIDGLHDVWRRRPDAHVGALGSRVRLRLLKEAATTRVDRTPGPVALVVAAPVTAADLDAVVAVYPTIAVVVDLRSVDQSTPTNPPLPTVGLADVLRAAPRSAETRRILRNARQQVRRCARTFASREHVRPFGWDDLCA